MTAAARPRRGIGGAEDALRADGSAIDESMIRGWRAGLRSGSEVPTRRLEARRSAHVRLRLLTIRGGQVIERRRAAASRSKNWTRLQWSAHSLRFRWLFSDRDSGQVLDHRTYVFSPGRGLVPTFASMASDQHMYLFLKVLHVLAVVAFLGNITTGLFWHRHAARTRDPKLLAHAMDGIIRSDRIFTIPGVVSHRNRHRRRDLRQYPILRTGWILWT